MHAACVQSGAVNDAFVAAVHSICAAATQHPLQPCEPQVPTRQPQHSSQPTAHVSDPQPQTSAVNQPQSSPPGPAAAGQQSLKWPWLIIDADDSQLPASVNTTCTQQHSAPASSSVRQVEQAQAADRADPMQSALSQPHEATQPSISLFDALVRVWGRRCIALVQNGEWELVADVGG